MLKHSTTKHGDRRYISMCGWEGVGAAWDEEKNKWRQYTIDLEKRNYY